MKNKYGLRCAYCQCDLSKSYRWILDNCPVMMMDDYVQHLVDNHLIKRVRAKQQFKKRFETWKEKI